MPSGGRSRKPSGCLRSWKSRATFDRVWDSAGPVGSGAGAIRNPWVRTTLPFLAGTGWPRNRSLL